MKKTLYVILMLIAFTCLVGCSNDTLKEFDHEITVECQSSTVFDINDANEKGTVVNYTYTFYFNKQGILYMRKDHNVYQFINSDAYKVYKETAEEGYKNKDYDALETDDDKMMIMIESSISNDPETYTDKEKRNLYITNYLKDNELINDTCIYNGITKKEIEHAK